MNGKDIIESEFTTSTLTASPNQIHSEEGLNHEDWICESVSQPELQQV